MGKRWIISVLCSLLCFLGAALAQNGEFQQGRTKIKAPVAEKESAVIQQTIFRPAEPKVPDLTNHNLTDAKTLLGNVFVLGEPRYVPSKKLAGLIVRQFPEAGSPAKSGTEVEVWVSTPVKPETNAPTPVLVPVPGLIGHKRDVAIGMLALVGLQAGDITQSDSEETDGIVLSQDPASRVRVEPKARVSFVVSRHIQRTLTLTAPTTSALPRESMTFVAQLSPPFPGAEFQFTFGDGQSTPWNGNRESTHSYSKDGNFHAQVAARWNESEVPSNQITVAVHAVTYSVTLTPNSMRAKIGDQINFRADVDPLANDAIYIFNFGDGTKSQPSRSPIARHAYARGGSYAAHVTVQIADAQETADEHSFASPAVQLMVALDKSPVPSGMNRWLSDFKPWIIGGAVLLIAGFLLRMVLHGKRPSKRKLLNVDMRVVVPPGELLVTFHGRLWARIEAVSEKRK